MMDEIEKRQTKLKEQEFVQFIKDVIDRKTLEKQRHVTWHYVSNMHRQEKRYIAYDAMCWDGIDNVRGPVILELKVKKLSRTAIDETRNRMKKDIEFRCATIIFIVNDYVDFRTEYNDVQIWDLWVIERWIRDYPIEYMNAVRTENELGDSLCTDWDEYSKWNWVNIEQLSQKQKDTQALAIVLGAGVSKEQGAYSWDEMLTQLKDTVKAQTKVKDIQHLVDKVGNTSLTVAQLYKDMFKTEKHFIWKIHQLLYGQPWRLDSDSELAAVAKLARKFQNNKHFRILTYNYDDFLERYLENEHIMYTVLEGIKEEYRVNSKRKIFYEMQGNLTGNLPIYHVHGYLPEAHSMSSMRGSVCLTEADYHLLYNQPYSWPIVSQMSFFRENICLFIGCSLADPNVRRLLEISKVDESKHYAVLNRDGLSESDLAIATKHFYRLGVRVIWIEKYSEIAEILKKL